MNAIFYITIFIIGILFGSFYTLAIYRIPRKQNITHVQSYCPNCGHKLGFIDLIPILSYLCLGGKCRYCKEKIKSRYIIIELFSGILFVLIAILLNFDISSIKILEITNLAIFALYITFGFLIAGIDKESKRINKPVLMYGIIVSIIYIIYLSIIDISSIYRYVIYLLLYIIILYLDAMALKKQAKDSYIYGLLLTILVMAIFTTEIITGLSIILTLIIVLLYIFINKFSISKNKRTERKYLEDLPICYCLVISNFAIFVCALITNNIL